MIAGDPALSAVTAGLYTGEQSSGGRTRVSADGLITDRALMHDAPPDILLTNYKMLDHMLLHPGRADMWRLSAESLQYLVLDEFHTYDGAQGTDVAMLLRRLGLTLKSHWTDSTSRVTEEDRRRPLGKVTPVATSATLGSQAAPTAMVDFAHTVFGEEFDADAVIDETRLSPDRMARRAVWQPRRRVAASRSGSARSARTDHRSRHQASGEPGDIAARGVRRSFRAGLADAFLSAIPRPAVDSHGHARPAQAPSASSRRSSERSSRRCR